jgi:hypothetical protein
LPIIPRGEVDLVVVLPLFLPFADDPLFLEAGRFFVAVVVDRFFAVFLVAIFSPLLTCGLALRRCLGFPRDTLKVAFDFRSV